MRASLLLVVVLLATPGVLANRAPSWSNTGAITLPSIAEDTVSSAVKLSDLLQGRFSDYEGSPLGVAVTIAATSSGAWQFSSDGVNWTPMGVTQNPTRARLLAGDDYIRFAPIENYFGTVSMSVRAWDQTAGDRHDSLTVEEGSAGGSSSVSRESIYLRLTVSPVNDAPTLVENTAFALPSVHKDVASEDNFGASVSSLLSSLGVVDPDRPLGMAVVGVSQGSAAGQWSFSDDNGESWNDLTGASAASAYVLEPNYLLRFQPAGNVGDSYVRIVVWDRSDGAVGGSTVDTSARGGVHAYSANEGIVVAEVSADVGDTNRRSAGRQRRDL
eukprot:Opistho-1_new@100830